MQVLARRLETHILPNHSTTKKGITSGLGEIDECSAKQQICILWKCMHNTFELRFTHHRHTREECAQQQQAISLLASHYKKSFKLLLWETCFIQTEGCSRWLFAIHCYTLALAICAQHAQLGFQTDLCSCFYWFKTVQVQSNDYFFLEGTNSR